MGFRVGIGAGILLLIWTTAAFSQAPPGRQDSARPFPSPLVIPDESSAEVESAPLPKDTLTEKPDTTVVARDAVAIPPGVSAPQAEAQANTGDSDGDGIPDAQDHCPNTPRGLPVERNGCLVMTGLNRRLVLHATYFPGTTKPDPYTISILDDLIIRLKDSAMVEATIEGFTDNIGEDSANLVVSQKRADKVKAYLVRQGIAASRLRVIGRGESNPIADNQTASGRRKNRRIEITFHHPE